MDKNKMKYIAFLCLFVTTLSVVAKDEPVTKTAGACVLSGDRATLKCASNEKIAVANAGFAFEPTESCSSPSPENQCRQTRRCVMCCSEDAFKKAKEECNDKSSCSLSVPDLNSGERYPGKETLSGSLSGCPVNGEYYTTAPMNMFYVDYTCITIRVTRGIESPRAPRSLYGRGVGGASSLTDQAADGSMPAEGFQFCKEIKSEGRDLVVSTEQYPEKVITNPTCECTFATSNPVAYHLVGKAQCNGTVMFITEEYTGEDEVEKYEYSCNNTLFPRSIQFGLKNPHKIKLSVDVERSDENSAYTVIWFSVEQLTSKRAESPIHVDCVEGSLWLTYTTKLMLMIFIPLGVALLVALIVIYCICKRRRRRNRRLLELKLLARKENAADGKSTSSVNDQEPWHSTPEVQINELARAPRLKSHLTRSQSAIPHTRNNDLAANPRLSRSRHSVRSMKRQAPNPRGPPSHHVLHGLPDASLALLTARNIIPGDHEIAIDPVSRRARPSAPPPTPPELDDSRLMGSEMGSNYSPHDNIEAEPMLPYRQHRRRSSRRDASSPLPHHDPVAPATLLVLDNLHHEHDSRPYLRNYHSNQRLADAYSPASTPRQNSPQGHRKVTALPSNSNNNLVNNMADNDSRLRDSVVSSEDDMMIMRPSSSANTPFTGYSTPERDNRHQQSDFDPGMEASPYEDHGYVDGDDDAYVMASDDEDWVPMSDD